MARTRIVTALALFMLAAGGAYAQDAPSGEGGWKPWFEVGLGGGLAVGAQRPLGNGGIEELDPESGVVKYAVVGLSRSSNLTFGLEATEWSPGWRGFPRLGALLLKLGYTPRDGAHYWFDLGVGLSRQQIEDPAARGEVGSSRYGLALHSGFNYGFPLAGAFRLVVGVGGIANLGNGEEFVIPAARVGVALH